MLKPGITKLYNPPIQIGSNMLYSRHQRSGDTIPCRKLTALPVGSIEDLVLGNLMRGNNPFCLGSSRAESANEVNFLRRRLLGGGLVVRGLLGKRSEGETLVAYYRA